MLIYFQENTKNRKQGKRKGAEEQRCKLAFYPNSAEIVHYFMHFMMQLRELNHFMISNQIFSWSR